VSIPPEPNEDIDPCIFQSSIKHNTLRELLIAGDIATSVTPLPIATSSLKWPPLVSKLCEYPGVSRSTRNDSSLYITRLGDTGIAVHPNDERYKHLVGRTAVHPFIEGRRLPIVADDYVDPEFGTGCVKSKPVAFLSL